MAEIKRLHYFTHEFLLADDFTAEQAYHRQMRHRHNRACHGFGIAEGLTVTQAANRQLRITSGMAFDDTGREITLADPLLYDLSGQTSFLLTLSYGEANDQVDLRNEGPVSDYVRVIERPQVHERPTTQAPPASEVVLAQVTLNNTGAITAIDHSVAQPIAGVHGLAPDSVDEAQLVAGSVTSEKLRPGAVVTDSLHAQAVTREKLADGSVHTEQLAPASIPIAALKLTASKPATPLSLPKDGSSTVNITVDSLIPQFLFVGLLPTTANSVFRYTQTVGRTPGGENSVTYTVTVTNMSAGTANCDVTLQTFATA